jgi:sterol desaturase/sphingolipid hydroxylase (fatty acid hydroxylase superfamily)
MNDVVRTTMMDDGKYGARDKRGNWKPFARVEYPRVFTWPVQPLGVIKWLLGSPGHILPWNLLYAAIAVVFWKYLTPPLQTMKTFEPSWIMFLIVRNGALSFVFYGFFHWLLYIRKAQGRAYKYNAKWPDEDNSAFLFKRQILDNMIWSLASGVPIWTAYEVFTLWAFANGYIPFVSWEAHPVYCILVMLLVPLFREIHFYVIHRLIHWPPLYRTVHRLHHNNVNPGPWSGLAMHPLEHAAYFSGVLIHWVVPSHPLHALFQLFHAGLSPALGHTGFDRVSLGKGGTFQTEGYAHYLHHKYFRCNYADGSIPIDKWLGTFHDGSDEAHEAMKRRSMAHSMSRKGQAS